MELDETLLLKYPLSRSAGCKSALNPHRPTPPPAPPPPPPPPVGFSADRSKAVVPLLVLLFVTFWFILRGDLFYVLPFVIVFLCFSVLLALRLPRLGTRELVLVLFVRLFDLRLFGFVCLLFLLLSGKGCDLWLWHSLDFSHTHFFHINSHASVRVRVKMGESLANVSIKFYKVAFANKEHRKEQKLETQFYKVSSYGRM